MREFTTTIDIAAAPAAVWRVLADVERWHEWTASIRRIERLDTAAIGVGSRVRIEQPRLRAAVWTVTDWRPELGFSWVSRNPGVVAGADHSIEPTAGGCRVTLTVHFGGLLGSIVGALAKRLTNEYLALEAAGLKRESERR